MCTHFMHIIVFSVGTETKVLCAPGRSLLQAQTGTVRAKAVVTELLSGLSRAVARVNSQQV